MNLRKLTRRRFLCSAAVLAPAAAFGDSRWLEPRWVKTKHLSLSKSTPTCRLVHFSDIHHKGDVPLLKEVVSRINGLLPDLVCFTGDIVEEERFLTEALDILAAIKAPMFGIPGNHEYWSKVPFAPIGACFAATGGAWLMNEARVLPLPSSEPGLPSRKLNIIGVAEMGLLHPIPPTSPEMTNLLLIHYPAWVKELGEGKYDLILAGHSHGGQVRIPFYGPVMVPFGVDEYDLGFFNTGAGPLYVNPGIGYIYKYQFRFNCRPEITVIEL